MPKKLTEQEVLDNMPFPEVESEFEEVENTENQVPKTIIKQPTKQNDTAKKVDEVVTEVVDDAEKKKPVAKTTKGKAKNASTAIALTEDLSITTNEITLAFSKEFEDNLAQIRPTLEKLSSLQKIDLTKVDDDEIAETLRSLGEAQSMKKSIDESRKMLKNHFDNIRDENIAYFDKRLEEAGYDELVEADKDIKQLKKDVSAHRINKRWEELKETFNSCLEAYPIISDTSEALTDYSRFRIRHADIVSGARKDPITDRHRGAVNKIMYAIAENLSYLAENPHGLNQKYFGVLLKAIEKANAEQIVDINWVMEQESIFYDMQVAELNNRKQAQVTNETRKTLSDEEKAHQASLQKQREQAQERTNEPTQTKKTGYQPKYQPKASKRPQPPLNPSLTNNPNHQLQSQQSDANEVYEQFNAPERFKWVIDYIMEGQNGKFRNIAKDPKVKVQFLYTMWTSFDNPESIFVKMTNNDPEVVLELSTYIHSL